VDESTNGGAALSRRGIIVVGASWGGVDALRQLAAALPPDLPAALFIVLHMTPESPSMLPHLLARAGPLHACHPRDGEVIRNSVVYVAPPDHHMLLEDGRIRLSRGPRALDGDLDCRPGNARVPGVHLDEGNPAGRDACQERLAVGEGVCLGPG